MGKGAKNRATAWRRACEKRRENGRFFFSLAFPSSRLSPLSERLGQSIKTSHNDSLPVYTFFSNENSKAAGTESSNWVLVRSDVTIRETGFPFSLAPNIAFLFHLLLLRREFILVGTPLSITFVAH